MLDRLIDGAIELQARLHSLTRYKRMQEFAIDFHNLLKIMKPVEIE